MLDGNEDINKLSESVRVGSCKRTRNPTQIFNTLVRFNQCNNGHSYVLQCGEL